METVNTIEIDGEQWEVEDSVARADVATVTEYETQTFVQDTMNTIVQRIGKICLLDIYGHLSANYASVVTIYTLPEEWRPRNDSRFVIFDNSRDVFGGQGVVRADGSVQLYITSYITGNSLAGRACYFLN